MKNRTVCFTGHRKLPQQQRKEIEITLRATLTDLINSGYCCFLTGGALGFDTLAAQTVLDLKKSFTNIQLILVLPCKNQTRGWRLADVKMYEYILSLADRYIYTSENYYSGCMQKRNQYLVDNSSVCICYLTEVTGGTFYTAKYAENQGLKIINIAK